LDVPVLTRCTLLPIAYSAYCGPILSIDNAVENLAQLFFSGVLSQIPKLKVIGADLGGEWFSIDTLWRR
jgi:hypothetical protein